MATYATDLQLVNEADSNTNWAELSGHTSGGAATSETDYYIQNSGCVSQSMGQGTGTGAGLQYDSGSNISWTTGYCFFVWQIFTAPNAIDTWDNGGLRIGVGSTSGNMNYWKAVGNDFGAYPYGGWQNTAIDPTFTPDYTDGSPTAGNYRLIGSWPNRIAAVTKGNPHGVDVIRYGRGQISATSTACTFTGMAAANDAQTARWGLLQARGVGFLWKGQMNLGTAAASVTFSDSNKNITIDDTPRTYADFNRVDFNNASSSITWSNINFTAANPAQLSRGRIYHNAGTVSMDACGFTDMDTFSFGALTATNCTFRRCNAVTVTGASTMTNTQIFNPTVAADTSALVWNPASDPSGLLDGMQFSKGTNAHHAIEFGTSTPTTMTLVGMEFSGFNASNGQNDSTLHIKRTTGTVTIYLSGCTGNISYKSAGATVTLVNAITLELTGLKNPTEVRVFDEGTTTEIAGAENVTTGTFSTGIDATTYPAVDISIISLGYQNLRLLNVDTTSDVSIPIQQIVDRQYFNP